MATTLHRTARIALRTTKTKRRRCFGLLRSAGDVRAWVIDCNRQLREWKLPPVVSYRDLCRELVGTSFGELDVVGARSVLRPYSSEWFEAARRAKVGGKAGFPRRKRGLLPVRYYHGTFRLHGRRLGIPVARGCPPLVVSLARPVPYPQDTICSVTLMAVAGRLFVDVTAALTPEEQDLDPGRVAGVDLGIIHPFALAGPAGALLISGRALRAECHLHLSDTKGRAGKMGRRAPSKGQRGSRRWRKLRRTQARAEARHGRRIRQAHHEAAKAVVAWAVKEKVGTLVLGDPEGICRADAGRRQNLRLRRWRRTHLVGVLKDKAAMAGIAVVEVDERDTSSTCPRCRQRVPKPSGRHFACSRCGFVGHRDIVGAANIAARGGGMIRENPRIEHRRVGEVPTRRDRRRHRHDARRSCLAHGRPGQRRSGSRSSGKPAGGILPLRAGLLPISAPGEEPLTDVQQEGKGKWSGH